MIDITIIVILSIILTGIILIGYPFFIYILSKLNGKYPKKKNIEPSLTLIIPTYNEKNIIMNKINNTLELDYPSDKLEIIFIDSASNDGTTDIIRQACINKRYSFIYQDTRKGKASAINVILKRINNELVGISDADAILPKDSLKKIVMVFNDPTVGAATLRYKLGGNSFLTKLASVFFKIFRENVNYLESVVDSASFFPGELYVFRRSLISEIEKSVVADDVYVPLKVRKQGYRSIVISDTFAIHFIPEGITHTFNQRRRTTYGILNASSMFKDMLFNIKYGYFGCIIFPSSFLRIIFLPFILLLMEFSFIYYILSMKMMTIFYIGIIFSILIFLLIINKKWDILIFPFIMQFAITLGVIDFLFKNNKHVLWTKGNKAKSVKKYFI